MMDLTLRPSDHLLREHALILAVLDQAVTDILWRPAWKPETEARWKLSGVDWVQNRLKAYAWLFLESDDEQAVFSYAWCCAQLDMHPQVLRDKLRAEHHDLLEYLHRQYRGQAVTPALQAAGEQRGRRRAYLTQRYQGRSRRRPERSIHEATEASGLAATGLSL